MEERDEAVPGHMASRHVPLQEPGSALPIPTSSLASASFKRQVGGGGEGPSRFGLGLRDGLRRKVDEDVVVR